MAVQPYLLRTARVEEKYGLSQVNPLRYNTGEKKSVDMKCCVYFCAS